MYNIVHDSIKLKADVRLIFCHTLPVLIQIYNKQTLEDHLSCLAGRIPESNLSNISYCVNG